MGRTKHALPPRSKSERELDHEIGNIVFVLNAIDAGRLDHLFVDAETAPTVRRGLPAPCAGCLRPLHTRGSARSQMQKSTARQVHGV